MADRKNAGQFGNRKDTVEQAREGGKASPTSFKSGDKRTSDAGKKGGQMQPREAKAEGGRHSHSGDS